jgi:F-type H+-transporting ATPase subunit c
MRSYARQPELERNLFTYTLLAFALVEAIALFGLMMAFVFIFAI